MAVYELPSGIRIAVEFEQKTDWPFLPHVSDELQIQEIMRTIGAVLAGSRNEDVPEEFDFYGIEPEVVCCCGDEHDVTLAEPA